MKRKNIQSRRCCFLLGFLFTAIIFPKGTDELDLKAILGNIASYCDVLNDLAVYYYCQETVKETVYPIPLRFRGFARDHIGIQMEYSRFRDNKPIVHMFLYDYQLIRKRDRARERRILLEENGEPLKKKKKSKLKTMIFGYKTVIFGPLVFSAENQALYRFNIVRHDRWRGRDVLVIRAHPKPLLQRKLTFGEFWVDRETFGILKIEISQKSMSGYHHIEEKAKIMNAEPQITIVMEYDKEKNGIRFPSRFFIQEAYITPESEKILLTALEVHYEDYHFFTVGVKIRETRNESLKNRQIEEK